MISVPEVTIERIAVAEGHGESLRDLALRAVSLILNTEGEGSFSPGDFGGVAPSPHQDIGGVIVATFSNPRRFPSLAIEIAALLGLPSSVPAFDLQLACSAYPYALYLGSRIAADTGKKVLIIDGDVQSRLVDPSDHDTGSIFSDAVTATVVQGAGCGVQGAGQSYFDFYSRFNDEALACGESGPIRMKGFDVFAFVATDVSRFLKEFITSLNNSSLFTFLSSLLFVPHQANPYMIRQLAKSIGLSDQLLTLDEAKKNPGSCSIPMTLAAHPECRGKNVLLAGFGAGYSAAASLVKISDEFKGGDKIKRMSNEN